MVSVHNTFIRGLTSMILQAEQIPASEHDNFIVYCLLWSTLLSKDHDNEQEYFFGALDKKYGQGTMQESLDEHAAFHDGLDRFTAHLASFPPGKAQSFSGKTLVNLINGFAKALLHHLNAEIETILTLSHFPRDEVKAIFKKTNDEAFKEVQGKIWSRSYHISIAIMM
jgi:hypothetical protein